MALKRNKYTLSNDDIDLISGTALEELEMYRISKENLIKTRFSLEEVLLRMQETYGKDTVIEVSTGRRFRRHIVEVRVEGQAYNPLRFSESENREWDQLLSYADYQPDYIYHNGVNLLRWFIPARKHHPAISFASAIVAGIIVGFAGRQIPAGTWGLLSIMQAVEEVWIRLLNVISGPIIFLLIITTVLNMDELSRQGGSTNRFIARVFRIGFTFAAISIAACILASPKLSMNLAENPVSNLVFLLLQLIPEDILSPFAKANSPQLLLLAFVLGSALIASGRKYERIAELVREANSVGLLITRWMSEASPFFVFVLLAYEIIKGATAIYAGMWKPLLLFLIVSTLLLACSTLYIAYKEKVPALLLVRKLSGPFTRTVTEGSSDNVYDETLRNCHSKLGIDEHYAESGMSIGLVLFMPVSAVGSLIFTMYAAGMNEISPTLSWYIIAAVTAVAMTIASPPVHGVAILTYVLLFSQLGIPRSALIAAFIFDILTDVIMTAENQYMLQLDMILMSDRMAMLDHKILESDN